MSLEKEIMDAINRASAENQSNTPDFILASYLMDCLAAFEKATKSRTSWYEWKDEWKPEGQSSDS